MNDTGWIKLHRDILNWEWYTDDVTKSIYLHLLLTVNYEPRKWRGVDLEAGERPFSIVGLAEETRHTVRQTRTALERLKTTCQVTIKTTHRFSIVKVHNYGLFEGLSDDERHAERHAERQTNDTLTTRQTTYQTTQYKEYKEIKKERNKEENRINNSNSKAAFGRNRNVYLTTEEFEDLAEEFGYEAAMEKIETESAWKVKRGAEIDNDFALIRKWLLGDKERGLLEKPKPMVTEKPTEQLPEEEEEEEISDEEWLKL